MKSKTKMNKTFKDFKRLARNREHFLHYINLLEKDIRTGILIKEYGCDFRIFRTWIPKTKKEFLN